MAGDKEPVERAKLEGISAPRAVWRLGRVAGESQWLVIASRNFNYVSPRYAYLIHISKSFAPTGLCAETISPQFITTCEPPLLASVDILASV